MKPQKDRSLGEDIDTLRAMGKYYSERPDVTIHTLRGLDDAVEALEHRWEVTHNWEKYPIEEVVPDED